MPLYMLPFPLIALVALYARAEPSLVSAPNHLFIDIARAVLPPILVGVIAAGAVISALVVLAGTCLVISPLLTRNILCVSDDRSHKRASRVISLLYIGISIVAAQRASSLAAIMGTYSFLGMAQFLPGVLGLVCGWRVPPLGVLVGIVIGDGVAIGSSYAALPLFGINPGLIGLLLNASIVIASIVIAVILSRQKRVQHAQEVIHAD